MKKDNKTELILDPRTVKVLKTVINHLESLVQQTNQETSEKNGEKGEEELKINIRLSNQRKKYIEAEFVKTLNITWKDSKKYTSFAKQGLTSKKLKEKENFHER